MCDKLTYDLSQEVEGSPSIFVRKDWINILDNMTQNYSSNQSVLDTSQLSNSTKYMSYREAYFLVPMTITMASLDTVRINTNDDAITFGPEAFGRSVDNSLGLKSWYGNIIHSFTLDYNGSTIVQQTPFVNMWNSFKLMTSLSFSDIITQGCTIGFYPDDPETFSFFQPDSVTSSLVAPAAPLGAGAIPECISGTGTTNNSNYMTPTRNLQFNQQFKTGKGNLGLIERCKWISFDSDGRVGVNYSYAPSDEALTYGQLLYNGNATLQQLWKNYVSRKINQVPNAGPQTQCGVIQYSVIATIYLKHVHSFFNMVPLLKGVFMKMTMNLNNSASTVLIGGNANFAAVAPGQLSAYYQVPVASTSALGGVNPLMLSSNALFNGCDALNTVNPITPVGVGIASLARPYRLSVSVGARCLDAQTTVLAGFNNGAVENSCKSIYLYIPAYTFNLPFEKALLASPVKSIKYTDIYQYQVLGVGGGQNFNNLLTNGIANVKSVLLLPFFSAQNDRVLTSGAGNTLAGVPAGVSLGQNTGFIAGVPVWQSPFDPAGCGPTSPLCHFTNFNVQVSGQNAIYNLQLRGFEQFNNQLYGQNAVNGGLTDGITSSLVDRQAFDMNYCYYYVNVERMLPVEQSVPKSIQILGTNLSAKAVDLMCFVEYGTEVNIDLLTGARV